MAIRLASGANALETGNRIKAKMEELSKYFPPGMKVVYPYDTTPFVKISIEEVVKTLIEAVMLVFIIMFLFLQNFRATLIPTIAVPVVLLGTFGVLSAAGFSINTLTMFALVIVIGLLVDDAIVVVENVERIMTEEGLPPKEATIKSMGQITSALWGIVTVLTAVFVPMAFFGGSTGVIYRQFSITIISAMILSVLRGDDPDAGPVRHDAQAGGEGPSCRRDRLVRRFFRWFNRSSSSAGTSTRGSSAAPSASRCATCWSMAPSSPAWRSSSCACPRRSCRTRTRVSSSAWCSCRPEPPRNAPSRSCGRWSSTSWRTRRTRCEAVITVAGFSFAGRGQNMGLAFVRLKDWKLRKTPRPEGARPSPAGPWGPSRRSRTAWPSPSRRRR